MLVWGVLLALDDVLEAVECLFDVSRHGEPNSAGDIVPVEGDAAEKGSRPVNLDFIVLFQGCDEMIDVGLVDIFDAEVVDT